MPSDPAKLDDGDRAILRECPFKLFVPNTNHNRALAARLKRLRSLVIKGFLHGGVGEEKTTGRYGGYQYQVTLTANGRVALGLPPEAPAPEPPVS
jgi:hypothetical protein